jgi:SRSO17 transposase
MTKLRLAQDMLERAIASKTPFAWVAADAVYGASHLERALRRAGKGYVLGVKSSHTVKSPSLYARADEIAQGLPASAWKRYCAGEGTQGPRLHDWAYLRLIDQEASDYDPQSSGLWPRGLLIRRRLLDGERAYFSTWAPQGTSMETLAHVEGHRWSIEQSFEAAKGELGLDHNETRSWHGWHRHVSLVMLAFALLAKIRRQANLPIPKKTIQHLMALTHPN